MNRYIKLDEKKLKQLLREAQMFQDDIVCAVGTDYMQKIAEAENKMIFDILKGLESEPPADVEPVRLGEWRFWEGWISNSDMRIEDATCSICGYIHPTVRRTYGVRETPQVVLDRLGKYCENCGAKMYGRVR